METRKDGDLQSRKADNNIFFGTHIPEITPKSSADRVPVGFTRGAFPLSAQLISVHVQCTTNDKGVKATERVQINIDHCKVAQDSQVAYVSES